jgi:hypothetical protein
MRSRLTSRLLAAWDRAETAGLLLGSPRAPVETRTALDPATWVVFRFRWLPHREIRADADELARRGIVTAPPDAASLVKDPRDPSGRHCFLCRSNIRLVHPREDLVPLDAAGRRWWAGANFAWLGRHHFTVMSDVHEDQVYAEDVLAAMLDIHRKTRGTFRIVFNGEGAGATIPWHLHLQITTERFPVEDLHADRDGQYPIALHRFRDAAAAHRHIEEWRERDPEHHRVNLLVAGSSRRPQIYVVPRDTRRPRAAKKGLMGGFEVAGDFAFSEPDRRADFEQADLATAREALRQIVPPALGRGTGAGHGDVGGSTSIREELP